ncbi:hypothetical protein NQ314_002162 [Rhamnusium bicolor]|uniref:RB1-inducible coiled-coil protein 1 n=1 Tax=Rhamnusium bicolor TaxID=1586634 RepID=A0AAV8ZSZ8_9CUCU|nr:hypothetical protein NQ314_002162 [Rhamnusium bicolor]
MLFVFHVDTGKMMTLDMSLALESVEHLQNYVEETCNIPAEKQVLLISGGQSLEPHNRVCSYSAGTDTNPIFLFSKSVVGSSPPPHLYLDDSEDEKQNLETESKASEDNTNTSQEIESTKGITLYEWISACDKRNSIDQLFEQSTRGLSQFDDQLIRDIQRDIEHILKQADNLQMKEVKGIGERLFGLETLMAEAKNLVQQQSDLAESFIKNQSRASNMKDQSILPDLCASHKRQLQIIAANHKKLYDIRRRCAKAKEELSLNLYHRLRWIMYIEDNMSEVDQKLVIFHENLRRLRMHLDALYQIHRTPNTYFDAIIEVVQEGNILNPFYGSLFPGMEDLPPAFAIQAPAMFDINLPKIQLEDVERLKKESPELADYLNIPDMTAVTNFFMKSFMKKEEERPDKTKAVEQKIVQAVSEVGLGSNLDHNLLKGAGSELCLATTHGLPHLKDLDSTALLISKARPTQTNFRGCESETDTEEFEKVGQSPLELHFDKQIPSPRPGTQDASTSTEVGERSPIPPKKPPRAFQKSHLHSSEDPSISLQRTLSVSSTQSNTESFTNIKNPSLESIDELSSLKNLTSNTESCFNSHYQQMQSYSSNLLFRSKSISPHTPQSPKDVQANSPNSPVLGHQPSNDFINDEFYIDESLPSSLSIETGNSQGEFVKQLDTANNVVALLQDNLQISRSEHDRLRSVLMKMQYLTKEVTVQLRSDLSVLKAQVLSETNVVSQHYEGLSSSWENLILEKDIKEKELVKSIKKEHELTMNDLRKIEKEQNEQIENLLNVNELQENMNKISMENKKKIEELQTQLQEKELEKDRNVKEITDRLNRDHKAEIENIRSRFKLMTMEKSPSETNLEKSNEFSSLPNSHSTLLLQMTENFELDKEKAVNEALRKENVKWEKLVADKIKEMETKFEEERDALLQDVAKRISEEKDKQIDLAECETESHDSDMFERISILQKEKEQLEEELEKIKNEKISDLSASVAVYEGKIDASTSPIKHRENMAKSEITVSRSGKLNIESCKAGDQVLVLWDVTHESFKILQENKHMYFLHSDYLEALGLEVTDGKPNKNYCTGEVIDKEYCHARKSENRYKVPKGTKFFRVKVKPLTLSTTKDVTQSLYHPKSTILESSVMSMSHSTISTITEIIPEDQTAPHSLPSSPTRQHPVIIEKSEEKEQSEGFVHENPDVFGASCYEKHFAEDSGIVDNIEQATAALDETLTAENRDESECSDR